jgi:hypothetical protein
MEDFTTTKLIELLGDIQNMEQNCLFIQVFPPEIVDEVWENLNPFSQNFTGKSNAAGYDFQRLLLIAFGAEGSIASEIRSGSISFPLSCWPSPDTLHFTTACNNIPTGVASQLIEALSISKLVIETPQVMESIFAMDFMLVTSRIRAVTFIDLSTNYQLEHTLFASPYLSELVFVRVEGAILPKRLDGLSGLKSLRIIHCPLNKVPTLNVNHSLERLRLSQCSLNRELDLGLFPASIEELDLSMNTLNSLGNLGHLKALKSLDVSNNQAMHFDLSACPISLETLCLRSNKLVSLACDGVNLPNLHLLDLGNNSLRELPKQCAELTSIKELLLSNNQFQELPSEICTLTALERLDLNRNFIRSIPSTFVNLKRLYYLDLEDNLLTEVYWLLSLGLWPKAKIRIRGNALHEEKRKLITLTNTNIDL